MKDGGTMRATEPDADARQPARDGAAAPGGPLSLRAARPWALAVRIVAVATAVVVGLWLLVTLRGIVLQVLIAVILAAGLTPLVERLHARVGLPRSAAVLLLYLGFVLALVALVLLIIPPVIDQILGIVANAPAYEQALVNSLRDIQRTFPFLPPLDQKIGELVSNLGNQLDNIASQALRLVGLAASVFGGILNIFLTLLITFYFVVDGTRIRDYLLSFLTPRQRERVRPVADRVGDRLGGWLLGQIALSGVIGLASYIALSILGVPSALLLAVLAGIGEAIPIIGPFVTAVPAVIVALTQSPLTALLTIIAYLVIQQLESNILAPNIMGKAVKLHPLAVVFALLVGGSLLGIIGAIVSVPLTAALSVILDEIRASRQRHAAASE